MSRVEFTSAVKVKRLALAEFKCEGFVERDDGSKVRCNAALAQGRVEFDHDIAAELGGDASFSNCRSLCRQCHRDKYPSDAAKIAKAKRREAKAVGADKPAGAIRSAGFPPSAKPNHPPRAPVSGPTGIQRRYADG